MSQSDESPSSVSVDAVKRLVGHLRQLAFNFRWTWRAEAAALLARMSPKLWERTGHNPVRVLEEIEDERLAELASDPAFVRDLEVEIASLAAHLAAPAWERSAAGAGGLRSEAGVQADRPLRVAYFCAEFGVAECLPIYAGGLGLLAGDHLKSASGLRLPLVGVGLMYHRGYFRQRLDNDGTQEEIYADVKPGLQPMHRVIDAATGRELRVGVDLPGRRVEAEVWRCDVGRVPLYLLDTDLAENEASDRQISRGLYLGDYDMRIRQEMVLGIGGVRALAAMGENATVFHMNEGHSAFLALERIRMARERRPMTFDQAREAVAAGHVFTTHTPVPAGIDRFAPSLVAEYFASYHASLGLDLEGLLALGRENVADRSEAFSMAVLAIRTSRFCNGVSRLHGKVSRGMWRNIWPCVPVDEVPIGYVTNGVHAEGWVGEQIAAAVDGVSKSWRERPEDPASWQGVEGIKDEELWQARCESRASMVEWLRERQHARAVARGQDDETAARAARVLDPHVLTIGFARRFAQYKRGTLLLRDPARLERLVRADRAIQVVIAGKAHPSDAGGKQIIRSIVRFARERKLEDRIVFVEDYDIDVARHLVRGCDVWLNTPIRGLEASGTSGMKAAMNGVIHVSTMDGWWDEGYAPGVGYHIESVGVFDDDMPNGDREDFESDSLYRLLEREIVPEFYEREHNVPRRWVARMKRCMAALGPQFNTHRMVGEYAEKYYFPAHAAATRLEADSFAASIALADHVAHFRRHWGRVRVNTVQSEPAQSGAMMDVAAVVDLGGLAPSEVSVQLRKGLLDQHGELVQAETLAMEHEKDLHDGGHRYRVRFSPARAPREAWIVRVLPYDPSSVHPYFPGLITCGTLNRAEAHVESYA